MSAVCRRSWLLIIVIVVGLGASTSAAFAASSSSSEEPSVSELAERLANLRSEVDELASRVDDRKQELRRRVRSLDGQKADLEMQIQRAELKVEKLTRKLEEQKKAAREAHEKSQGVKPAVEDALAQVRASVRHGVPFKRDERLADLEKLETQLSDGLLSPPKVASRLWQFVEDELRLTRESGSYRQIIELDEDEVLADVVRVGMIAMYFKTDDGRVGFVRKQEGDWRWREVTSDEARQQIRHLFESFNKGIRVGYFTIPNAFPTGGKR